MTAIDRETVRRLIAVAAGAAEYKFLFDNLTTPAWLGPLAEEGVFLHPPASMLDGERRVFLLWPPSRYLARVAAAAPREVAAIIATIPDTDNFRVHDDLLDAALAMPPEVASELADSVRRWLTQPYSASLCRPAASLMKRLAETGHGERALRLAKTVLRLVTAEGSGRDFVFQDARAVCSDYDYAWILEHDWPAVVATAGVRAWQFVRRLLEVAVDAHRDPETAPHDLSFIWRRTVLPSDQTIPYNIRGSLVEAVYRTARLIIESETADPATVYRELMSERWDIFRRIGLQVLQDQPDCEGAGEALLDRSAFEHLCLQHEYMGLLRRCFSSLSELDQREVLSWIDQGPDLAVIARTHQERTGAEPPEELLQHRKAVWQRDRLAPIAAHLRGEWHDRYRDLMARLGEGESEPMPTRISVMHGAGSPLSDEEGSRMRPGEWAAFLKEWTPPAALDAPSPEGLAEQLGREIGLRPAEFAASANEFQGVWPSYARAFANGMRGAVARGESLQVEAVLRWCDWLVGSAPKEVGASHHADDDPSWTWAKVEVNHLLAEWLKGPTPLMIDFRRDVWGLLDALLNDPDPNDGRSDATDPAIQALNTVRGSAMLAAIEYALWVRRSVEESGGQFPGISEMPEFAAALESHLDPQVDRAPAVRSVYGQRFPTLVSLDATWAAQLTERIFSWESDPRLASVAWQSYLDWWLPGQPSFGLLVPSYEIATQAISNADGSFEGMVPQEARLGEHLALLAIYGAVPISMSDGLLAAWYEKAGDRLSAHCVEFLGRQLMRTTSLHKDVSDRIVHLWELRVERCLAEVSDHMKELLAFGWLFAVPALPVEWRLTKLTQVLEATREIEARYFVMERLADDVQHAPAATTRAVLGLVRSEREPSALGGSDEIRAVIDGAYASGDGEAADFAKRAVEHLLRLGLEEYRDLARALR